MAKNNSILPISLGIYCSTWQLCEPDLRVLNQVLITGGPGQGKTNCINNIITSLLCRFGPEDVRFVLADPKKIELQQYTILDKRYAVGAPVCNDIVISSPEQIYDMLLSLKILLDERYDKLKMIKAKNIEEYNLSGTSDKMPYIIVVIDEFADIIMEYRDKFEDSLVFISQLGRAVGIHLIISTVCPSKNTLTSSIICNFTTDIVFGQLRHKDVKKLLRVSIEDLIYQQQGEMFISANPMSSPAKIKCRHISEMEITEILEKASQMN